jgi:hypothetical protein
MHIIIIWPTITYLLLKYEILHVADFTGPSTGRITLHLVHYLLYAHFKSVVVVVVVVTDNIAIILLLVLCLTGYS